ncbi:MAG: beta strand repeat-containing protein, partial [Pirellulales bacterium]
MFRLHYALKNSHTRKLARKRNRQRQRTLFFELLEKRKLLTIATWDGGGLDNHWTTPANWGGDIAPSPADDLVFPAGAAQVTNRNDFPSGTNFNSIGFSGGGYSISGNALGLAAGIDAASAPADNTLALDITLSAPQSILVGGAAATLTFGGAIDTAGFALTVSGGSAGVQIDGVVSGSGGLVKASGGGLTLTGANTYTGTTDINDGTLVVNGSIASAATPAATLTVGSSGTLAGSGTIYADVSSNGTVSPGASPGVLNITGNYTQGPDGWLEIEIGGLTAGSEYDQVHVSGAAYLDGALEIALTGGFRPQVGDAFPDVLTFASGEGDFATRVGLDAGQGVVFDPVYLATSLDVETAFGLLDTESDLTLRRAGDAIEIVNTGTSNLLASAALADVGRVILSGSDRADNTLVIDYSSGGSFPLPGGIRFDGGGGTDDLVVIGSGFESGTYTPDPSTTGNGTITVGGSQIEFTNLEPVTVSGLPDFTFITPGSEDVLLVDSPAAGQNRISGTSDGVAFESLTFYDIRDFTIDTATNDGASPNDSITIDASGLVASGLQTFTLTTGAGDNTLDASAFSGDVTLNGAAGNDTLLGGQGSNTYAELAGVDAAPGDAEPLYTFTVSNTADSGAGSLRQAIADANGALGMAVIDFQIEPGDLNFVDVDSALPGGDADPDVFVIQPASALPALNNSVTGIIVNGRTQTRFGGDTNPFGPEIVLDGSLAGAFVDGLQLPSDDNQVHGLNIQQFHGAGIEISGGNNWVTGSYIGVDATGTTTLGNGDSGVRIVDSSDNLIGGDSSSTRNVISGNSGDGVKIIGTAAINNVIAGNYIGTDTTGTVSIGNRGGVSIGGGASRNTVGGTEPGARNVISGGIGISGIFTRNNVVQGNYIGVDVSGSAALGAGYTGITISGTASQNIIGGASPGARNIISGYRGQGVLISQQAQGNVVAGNFIGTDVTGTIALGNQHGIRLTELAMGNVLGGTTPGSGNLISGNTGHGITNEGPTFTDPFETQDFGVGPPPDWTGFGNTGNRNDFGYSTFLKAAGGRFAHPSSVLGETDAPVAYYADTLIGGSLTLERELHAEGELRQFVDVGFTGEVRIVFFGRDDAQNNQAQNSIGLSIEGLDLETLETPV